MLSASNVPPPEWQSSLAALAAFARDPVSAGGVAADVSAGHVFVGEVREAPTPLPSFYEDAPEGLRVEFPFASATVWVVDSLGAAMDESVEVHATAGPERIVDEEGNTSDRWVVSGGSDVWRYQSLPEESEDERWVFFVVTRPEFHGLAWRAALVNDVVSGEGTGDGVDVPLESLRLP